MPLPSDPKSPWPPTAWAPLQQDVVEADAWYSGDAGKLTLFYGGPDAAANPTRRRRFWARANTDAQGAPTDRVRMHVPAAADIAATAADLLFGETPTFELVDDDTAADDVLARISALAEQDAWGAALVEAAEISSALGGVYLHPVWDTSVSNHPMLAFTHPDCAVPEFMWGRLTAVTFWHEVHTTGSAVVRHLERHEPVADGQPGVILHGLYSGTRDALGGQIPWEQALIMRPELANLAADETGTVHLPAGISGIDVSYVKNVGPNRKHRSTPVGRSDWQGCEDLMDALDETYTSWMRDIRLGKSRIIVPDQFLDRKPGRGSGASFDQDREVFVGLEMDPSSKERAQIVENQFAIRFAEHAATAAALFERIVVTAGYSPQSFGLQGDGGDQTATEVDAREGKSDRTTGRKRRYWESAIEDQVFNLLAIDRAIFKGPVAPVRPRLVWPSDPDQSPLDQSNTLNYLAMAQAASTKVLVEMLHPGWTADEVDAEVSLIQQEHAMVVPDPTGAPGFDPPTTDVQPTAPTDGGE